MGKSVLGQNDKYLLFDEVAVDRENPFTESNRRWKVSQKHAHASGPVQSNTETSSLQ